MTAPRTGQGEHAVRVLPCADPWCMCAGEGHECAGTCRDADRCDCHSCSLCGLLCDSSRLTVDEDGNAVGDCCEHRLDESGRVDDGTFYG